MCDEVIYLLRLRLPLAVRRYMMCNIAHNITPLREHETLRNRMQSRTLFVLFELDGAFLYFQKCTGPQDLRVKTFSNKPSVFFLKSIIVPRF